MNFGGGDNNFIFKSLVFALVVMLMLPTCISIFVDKQDNTIDSTYDNLIADYKNFTGTNYNFNENVWTLTNITTPYLGGSYNYSEDGWLYGSSITTYTPSQYIDTLSEYTIQKGTDGFYYYTGSTQDGHANGDLCSNISMDISKKSSIFFTESGKHNETTWINKSSWNEDFVYSENYRNVKRYSIVTEWEEEQNTGNFYYDYTGYRYVFQPVTDYYNEDGNLEIASKTSLSLIWYEYYTASGIAGQLVLTGSDSGVAYLTSTEIVKAFNSTNNTAKFNVNFNGNPMNLYVRINPYYTTQGMSIEDCYNNGYWSVMVSSISTDVKTYTSTDYSFNIANIWDTIIDLFTFNMDSYNLSPITGMLASILFSGCFYCMLISIGLTCYPVLLLAGIMAAIQAIANIGF